MTEDLLTTLLELFDEAEVREPGLSPDQLAETTAPIAPPDALWARLEASLDAEGLSPFAEQLGDLFDVGITRARELLGSIASTEGWEALLPGVQLFHLTGGPATAGADVGFIRVQPGAAFPRHRHRGDEHALILTGRLRDSDGSEAGAGERTFQPAGSEHSFVAVGAEETVFAVVVGGVDFID